MTVQLEERIEQLMTAPITTSAPDWDRLVDASLGRVARRRRNARIGFGAALCGGFSFGGVAMWSVINGPAGGNTIAVLGDGGVAAGEGPDGVVPAERGADAANGASAEAGSAVNDVADVAGEAALPAQVLPHPSSLGDAFPGLLIDALPAAAVTLLAFGLLWAAIRGFRMRRVSRPLNLTKRVAFALLASFVAALVTFVATFDVYFIPSGSMGPTVGVGDRVITSRGDTAATIGDIVVFDRPASSPGGLSARISRVGAVGGDTIEATGGELLVNGQERPYIRGEGDRPIADFGPVDVPEGMLFVLSDNHGASIDSRYYGPIEEDSLRGVVKWMTGSGALPSVGLG